MTSVTAGTHKVRSFRRSEGVMVSIVLESLSSLRPPVLLGPLHSSPSTFLIDKSFGSRDSVYNSTGNIWSFFSSLSHP